MVVDCVFCICFVRTVEHTKRKNGFTSPFRNVHQQLSHNKTATMAFMMPVMKNEFDIYKGRQRRISECSNQSNCRSRKVSESSRSDCPSLSTSPGNEGFMSSSPAHRSHPMYMSHLASRSQFSRNSSRTSQSSLIASSPSKASSGSSPPKGATGPSVPAAAAGSQSSLNKFHTRLVDKLRKSLRKSKSTDGRS